MVRVLVSLFFIIGAFLIYLRYIENRTLFYPSKQIEFLPKEAGLDFETVNFKTIDDVKLTGWLIPSKDARYTILFCHGNAGNISHRIEKIKFFNQIGCNVFIFDYRGYGMSAGKPYEKGLYLDAQAAYDYLLSKNISIPQIIGYGESLGGAVIVDLACKNKMQALILEGTFSSIKDMVEKTFPLLPYWIFSSRFDSTIKIKSLNIPKFIIHSINDEIVPYEIGAKLYEAAALPKEMLKVHGGHNSCFYESENLIREKVSGFIDNL